MKCVRIDIIIILNYRHSLLLKIPNLSLWPRLSDQGQRSQHYTGYLCDDLIFVAGSGFNPVPDLVGRTLIYQYIIRLSSG